MSSAIHLKCPNCGHPIRADDINILSLAAKCSSCGCVFPFKPRLFQAYSVPIKPEKRPKGVEIHLQDKELFLTYRWWTVRYLFLLLLGALWNLSTIMWFVITLANDAYLMMAMGMVFAVGGIALQYVSIAGFLNTTMIKVDDFQLSVTHQPVFWFSVPKLRRDEITQLYCTLHINRGQNYTQYSYQLNVILKNGKHVCILKGINNADQAQYLEKEIEHFLKIKDRYVKGEYIGRK
ncbi:MAG: zinc ribbon domain-containing protein [Chitinophagales bacterium]